VAGGADQPLEGVGSECGHGYKLQGAGARYHGSRDE
jgi:hypothetical protein